MCASTWSHCQLPGGAECLGEGRGVAVSLTRILSSDLPLLVSCLMARTNLMACLSSTFLMLSGDKRTEGVGAREKERE